jgi:transmembrane protein TMEM260 (protein O-mannosyltransferase)
VLLAVYVATLAPGVTFWDAGEFIAAAHVLGIPHPPGTPLYVALAHVWSQALGGVMGVARAINLFSAVCTTAAGASMAWLIARRSRTAPGAWAGVVGAIAAGLMTSVWSNATETEVYSLALLHSVALLAAAAMAGEGGQRDERWMMLTAYLIALAPAVHLSALVAVPAAIVLAARRPETATQRTRWDVDRVLLLGGALIASAGVGRMDGRIVVAGLAAALVAALRTRSLRRLSAMTMLAVIASSALLIMLVRARHGPPVNQGAPSELGALVDVVARRQYDVAPLLPRSAPVWLQLANVFQYVDWQAAMSWGAGIVTSPARVIATIAWIALAGVGLRAMRRESRELADALIVLAVCGTLGVAAYLNLKAGSSLGWGILPEGTPHEARERDYFFILGFWSWGCFAGAGAVALARHWRLPAAAGLAAVMLPLVGNWRSVDRSREPEASAARQFGRALLDSAPAHAVLFLEGDNDSYPIWYLQQVEGVRRDVLTVTVPLLPTDWYSAELARRSRLRWNDGERVVGARTLSEHRAALIAAAASRANRPVVASPAVEARERSLLGSGWVLRGPVFVANAAATEAGLGTPATVDSAAAEGWAQRRGAGSALSPSLSGDDVARVMLALLDCPHLLTRPTTSRARRDSLEVNCNLR